MDATRPAVVIAIVSGLLAAPARAKHDVPPAPIIQGWAAATSVTTTYTTDIFEEGPSGTPHPDVFTTLRADARRDVRATPWWIPPFIGVSVGGQLYDRTPAANNVFYEFAARERFGWGRPEVYYRGTPRQLLFIDEGSGSGAPPRNVLYGQNVFGAEVDRALLPSRRLRLSVGYEATLRNFRPPDDDRDYTGYAPSAEVRYEVAPWFVPRVRAGYDIQDAQSPNRSRQGVRTLAGFDGTWWRASWGFRWYLTRWNYEDAVPGDSNFERHDDRNALLVSAAVNVWRALSITTRYRFLDGASTRKDRNFTKNEIGGGLVYQF